jgi:hypothetical protein
VWVDKENLQILDDIASKYANTTIIAMWILGLHCCTKDKTKKTTFIFKLDGGLPGRFWDFDYVYTSKSVILLPFAIPFSPWLTPVGLYRLQVLEAPGAHRRWLLVIMAGFKLIDCLQRRYVMFTKGNKRMYWACYTHSGQFYRKTYKIKILY